MKLVPTLCAVLTALAVLVLSPNSLATSQIVLKHSAHIKHVTKGAAGTNKQLGTKKARGTKGASSLGDVSQEQQVQVQKAMSNEGVANAAISKAAKETSKTSNGIIQNVKH